MVALRKESVDRNPSISELQPLIASSLSARRAWIEIDSAVDSASGTLSLSARRAWIEICYLDNIEITQAVALRKESVDRNILRKITITVDDVALRKESVDRNTSGCQKKIGRLLSLSARRAWIEMCF